MHPLGPSHLQPSWWIRPTRSVYIKRALSNMVSSQTQVLEPDFIARWRLTSGVSWWRHQMETFSALLAICAGNSPVPGEFPAQRPVTRSFDVFFDLRLNKRLSKQSWGWWFETLSHPLWRHRNGYWESHCEYKAVLRASYPLNGIPYAVRRHLYIETTP